MEVCVKSADRLRGFAADCALRHHSLGTEALRLKKLLSHTLSAHQGVHAWHFEIFRESIQDSTRQIVLLVDPVESLRILRIQAGFNEVGQLLRGELVSLQVGDQFSIAIDQSSVHGVHKQSFISEGVDPEKGTYALNVGFGSREESPVFGICIPRLCVVEQNFGTIVNRIECDGEQNQVTTQASLL